MRFSATDSADRSVLVTEVGTRDGFQVEAEFIPTESKAAVINALIDAGVRSFEATSFVSPRARKSRAKIEPTSPKPMIVMLTVFFKASAPGREARTGGRHLRAFASTT